MSYRIYQFGTTALPLLEHSHDIGAGAARTRFTEVAGGQFDMLGSEKAKRSQQTLVYTCKAFDDTATDVQAQLDALKALSGTVDRLYAVFPSTQIRFAWARLTVISGIHGPRLSTYQPLTIQFVLRSQRWYDYIMHDDFIYDLGPSDNDLAMMHAQSGTGPYFWTLNNGGNVENPEVIFTITAKQAITAITIKNTITGHSFTYTGALAAGKTLVIDTGAMSVLNDGSDAYSGFTPPTDHAEWMILDPGDNDFEITVTGGSVDIEAEYYDAWA